MAQQNSPGRKPEGALARTRARVRANMSNRRGIESYSRGDFRGAIMRV